MRRPVDAARVRSFLKRLSSRTDRATRVYLTGGATAVLLGFRPSTIDIDLKFEPERDELLRALPELKEELEVNVELASPDQFIPEIPGWRERSLQVEQDGALSVYHYDLRGQALSKIERGHRQDLEDVAQMLGRGLVSGEELLEAFRAVEPSLYRFPAIDPAAFRRAVEAAVGGSSNR